jgi:hypothetical protein
VVWSHIRLGAGGHGTPGHIAGQPDESKAFTASSNAVMSGELGTSTESGQQMSGTV